MSRHFQISSLFSLPPSERRIFAYDSIPGKKVLSIKKEKKKESAAICDENPDNILFQKIQSIIRSIRLYLLLLFIGFGSLSGFYQCANISLTWIYSICYTYIACTVYYIILISMFMDFLLWFPMKFVFGGRTDSCRPLLYYYHHFFFLSFLFLSSLFFPSISPTGCYRSKWKGSERRDIQLSLSVRLFLCVGEWDTKKKALDPPKSIHIALLPFSFSSILFTFHQLYHYCVY